MVLEHLFPEDWLERKLRYAFLLAVVYSALSLIIARLLFAANSGLVSIVFTSLLLMPYLKKLLWKEEEKELLEKRFSLRHFWLDNREAVKVYFVLFFGIYLSYTLYTFFLPLWGFDIGNVFREQLALEMNLRGGASFHAETFVSIFLNNWWVLLACFLLSLIAGDGAIFFVAWNASSWGTIFGFRALEAAMHGFVAFGGGQSIAVAGLINLGVILAITLPHVILEGGAYILAAIAGGVLSDDVVSEKGAMTQFLFFFFGAAILFIVFHFLFSLFFVNWPLVGRLLDIVVILAMLHFLTYVFDDARHKEVFQYNYVLFLLAVLIFLIGALVETGVLSTSQLLAQVYWAALL